MEWEDEDPQMSESGLHVRNFEPDCACPPCQRHNPTPDDPADELDTTWRVSASLVLVKAVRGQ